MIDRADPTLLHVKEENEGKYRWRPSLDPELDPEFKIKGL